MSPTRPSRSCPTRCPTTRPTRSTRPTRPTTRSTRDALADAATDDDTTDDTAPDTTDDAAAEVAPPTCTRICDAPPAVDVVAACAGGAATVDVYLGEGCGGACDPLTDTCVYTPTPFPCPTDAKLAQTRGWQVALRAGLAAMTADDFAVPLAPMRFDPAWLDDEDTLFRMWLASDRNWYHFPGTEGLRVPADAFTLAGIEQPDGVHGGASTAEVNHTVFWYRWDYAGNPHHGSPAVARRAFVLGAVDLIMIDTEHDPGELRAQQHFLSGTMNWLAAAYRDGHAHVAACTAAAYRLGLQTMFVRLEDWDSNNGNNDMAQPGHLALYEAAAAMPDPSWAARAEAESREIFEASGYWHEDAGYFDHGVALDSSYEGISLHMLAAAALGTPYAHVDHALDKYMRLKSYLTLPEPDGVSFTSPSHWNPATGGGVTEDQWWTYARDVAVAMTTDHALYLVVGGRNTTMEYDPLDLVAMKDAVLARLPALDAKLTTPLEGFVAPLWVPLHWSQGRHAATLDDQPGFHARIARLAAEGSPLLKPPLLRGARYVERFGDDFVVANLATFAAIVYAGPIADTWAAPLSGMGGGALSAFWTPSGGAFLLGLTHGSQNPTPDTWAALASWPTQHLYGVTATGAFSTALVQRPACAITVAPDAVANDASPEAPAATIDIAGDLGPEAWSTADALASTPTYARSIAIDHDGVHVATTLASDDATPVCELVDVVPLYRKDYYVTDPRAEPVVTFVTAGGAHIPASETWTPAIVAVEIVRFDGRARVTLDGERRVRLAPLWENHFQNWAFAQSLHIDLIGEDRSGEACAPLPAAVDSAWSIAPE